MVVKLFLLMTTLWRQRTIPQSSVCEPHIYTSDYFLVKLVFSAKYLTKLRCSIFRVQKVTFGVWHWLFWLLSCCCTPCPLICKLIVPRQANLSSRCHWIQLWRLVMKRLKPCNNAGDRTSAFPPIAISLARALAPSTSQCGPPKAKMLEVAVLEPAGATTGILWCLKRSRFNSCGNISGLESIVRVPRAQIPSVCQESTIIPETEITQTM